MAAANKYLTLKLLVDKKNDVVLFAEAGKDVVDFIFHLLALPMGTVIRLLNKTTLVGSLGNIYESFEILNDTYLQTSEKDVLLKPKTPGYGGGSFETILLPAVENAAELTKTYYRCSTTSYSGCWGYVSHKATANCPTCQTPMSRKITLVEVPAAAVGTVVQSSSGGGYVKGVVTYMVMDNLVVKPMSTISSITLLNRFNFKDLNSLEEKIVDFGFEEGVKLLKALMESTTVLTDVFLDGKKRAAR